ncbi:MAG: agmatinase family protein [Porticoccaceae bacterium]
MTQPDSPDFDPALTGSADAGLFGIATELERSRLALIPVPWEVTTSYGKGTALGPEAIRKASPQLDLFQRQLPAHYMEGFHLLPADEEVAALNQRFRPMAEAIQGCLEDAGSLDGRPDLREALAQVNAASRRVNDIVYRQCRALDAAGKLLALVGGDHSSPYGQIRYLAEKYRGGMGVLHIDAHHDLRAAYQGFEFSHASIMRNVMALETAPARLVQVAIRDFSEDECRFAAEDPRIRVFYDEDIKDDLYGGRPFAAIATAIVEALPEEVYISFDIDGLRPDLCPHTGTPVAGGLEFDQARYLIAALVRSGRRIVGFDLCEVCPDLNNESNEWDGNVGARILFQLASWMVESQQRA